MARKINVFTSLIFAYSIIICLTCKKDFAKNEVTNNRIQLRNAPISPLVQQNTNVTPSIFTSYLKGHTNP